MSIHYRKILLYERVFRSSLRRNHVAFHAIISLFALSVLVVRTLNQKNYLGYMIKSKLVGSETSLSKLVGWLIKQPVLRQIRLYSLRQGLSKVVKSFQCFSNLFFIFVWHSPFVWRLRRSLKIRCSFITSSLEAYLFSASLFLRFTNS